jgi:hypothetical protein
MKPFDNQLPSSTDVLPKRFEQLASDMEFNCDSGTELHFRKRTIDGKHYWNLYYSPDYPTIANIDQFPVDVSLNSPGQTFLMARKIYFTRHGDLPNVIVPIPAMGITGCVIMKIMSGTASPFQKISGVLLILSVWCLTFKVCNWVEKSNDLIACKYCTDDEIKEFIETCRDVERRKCLRKVIEDRN